MLFVGGGSLSPDQEELTEPPVVCFAAIAGNTVVATFGAVPGHGESCPHGRQVKAALPDVFDFSVRLEGCHAFSVLQWPLNIGTLRSS